MQFYSPLTVIVGHNGSGKTASCFFLPSCPPCRHRQLWTDTVSAARSSTDHH